MSEDIKTDLLASLFSVKPDPDKAEQLDTSDTTLPAEEVDNTKADNISHIQACQKTKAEREREIADALSDLQHPDTAIGHTLAKLTEGDFQNQERLQELVADLENKGFDFLVLVLNAALERGPIDHQKLIASMRHVVNSLSNREKSIFEPISIDRSTPEEGKRRIAGQHILTIAKSYLFLRSLSSLEAQTINAEQVREAANAIYAAEVWGGAYPKWFSNAAADRLRELHIDDMSDADLDLLDSLSNNLMDRFTAITSDRKSEILATTNPDELKGIEFVFYLCTQAKEKAEELRAAAKEREQQEEYEKAYKENTSKQLRTIAADVKNPTLELLDSHGQAYTAIALENIEVIGKILQTSDMQTEGWWQEYVPANKNPQKILALLTKLAQPANIDTIATRMLDRNSGLYIHHDGSGNMRGWLTNLTPEQAREAAQNTAERAIFAALLGILEAYYLQDPEATNSDNDRHTVLVKVYKSIGRGRITMLLSGQVDVDPPFSSEQLRFRAELLKFIQENQDGDYKQRRLNTEIGKHAPTADKQYLDEITSAEQARAELENKKNKLREVVESAKRSIAVSIEDATELGNAASGLFYSANTDVDKTITVVGKGEHRKIAILEAHDISKMEEAIEQLTKEIDTATAKYPDQSLPGELFAERAKLKAQVVKLKMIQARIATLNQSRIVKPDGRVISGDAYYPQAALDNFTADTKRELQDLYESHRKDQRFNDRRQAQTVGPIGTLKNKEGKIIQALQSSDTRTVSEIDNLIAEVELLVERSESLRLDAESLLNKAAVMSVSELFSKRGRIDDESAVKRSKYYGIVRYK